MDLLAFKLGHSALVEFRLPDGQRLRDALAELTASRPNLHAELLAHKTEWPLGWLSLPWGGEWVAACERTAKELRGECDKLVVCGIGGSALGFQAVYTALDHPTAPLQPVEVIDNVDPTLLARVDGRIDSSRVGLNVISKSGSTMETMAGFCHLLAELTSGGEPSRQLARRIAATTDPENGPLSELAARTGWHRLPVPGNVAGRFSVLSPVGLLPLAFAGVNIRRLLAGAREMQEELLGMPQRTNPAWQLAAISYLLHVRGGIREAVHYVYGDPLVNLGGWFRQLWAESLAKAQTTDGKPAGICLTPVVARGATDQHSQNQLFIEGPNDKLFAFITCRQWESDPRVCPILDDGWDKLTYLTGLSFGQILTACYRGTRDALIEMNRPVYEISFPRLQPENVGAYLQLWMLATAYAGLLYGVNAFDQPGVERSKRITRGYLG